MIIDAHTHVYNSSVAGARENMAKWRIGRWRASGPDLVREMDEAGIDCAFLISHTGVDIMSMEAAENRAAYLADIQHYLTKDYYIHTWEQHRDRLFWFSDSVDPRVAGYVQRAEQDLEKGASGLKLLPAFVDTAIDDPQWEPVFELLRDRGKPCILDIAYWYLNKPDFAPSLANRASSYERYAEAVHKVAAQFPSVPIQLAHFGTPDIVEWSPYRVRYDHLQGPIDLIRAHDNLFADLAAYQCVIGPGEEFPYPSALRIVDMLVKELGAQRIMWGTDWPYFEQYTYNQLIQAIREAPFLQPDQVDLILGGNALRLLGR